MLAGAINGACMVPLTLRGILLTPLQGNAPPDKPPPDKPPPDICCRF